MAVDRIAGGEIADLAAVIDWFAYVVGSRCYRCDLGGDAALAVVDLLRGSVGRREPV